eukprot:614878-Pleurochrysis_carterae.AAC.1
MGKANVATVDQPAPSRRPVSRHGKPGVGRQYPASRNRGARGSRRLRRLQARLVDTQPRSPSAAFATHRSQR